MKEAFEFFKKNSYILKDKIERGIQENRKGLATITLKDKSGNVIENASVTMNQISHDFKFGCNIFMLDGFKSEEQTDLYKKHFKELFNLAVVPFYWGDLEPEKGKPRFSKDSSKVYRRPAPDLVLEFCEENNIEPKGHTLMWNQILPDWLDRNRETMKEEIDTRLKEIAHRYKDRIATWDIINEVISSNVEEEMLPRDYTYWTMKQAEKYFLHNNRFINEATEPAWDSKGELSAYSLLIENLLLRGIDVNGIGLQYHLFYKKEELAAKTKTLLNPNKLSEMLANYQKFNLPIHISEVTIPSYGMSKEEEDMQAELVCDLYSLWFSQPKVESIIWWNLVDGFAYVKENWDEDYYSGALLNKDFSKKKAYKVLGELINSKWRTSKTFSESKQEMVLDGFYGEYDIEIRLDGDTINRKIHLSKEGPKAFEIVIDENY